ncbi:hypothetical protein AUQ48_00955 [Kocuria flava]|uniref:Uncharacterized protein n=1 Tax=Kocuria flava TaxID=446860 RepID=A0A2N4SYM7_9MICC|nr:hypothetical protein [Kocuria flava]PLC11081.1 hypothetical protein AUQ48_00955 [Kocuria flava]
MTDPVDPLTQAAARARLAADAHRGVEPEPWIAELAQPHRPRRPGEPRPSAADVLSGRDDAHTAPTGRAALEWARDLADRGG